MPAFNHLLHFTPLYQTRVWGGRRLETMLGRHLPDAQPYGESWELVDRADAQSVVASGPRSGTTLHDFWAHERVAVFGEAYLVHPSPRFPLLIKILDCVDDLSLQVHPPASVAPGLGDEPKTEMWFVAASESGSHLYAGFREAATRASFAQALADGSAASLVHRLPVTTGDSLFVPSGRLHALGRGLLIYEIQQNSDTTYRVFDWNRLGLDGKPRTLHVDQSLRSIDFDDVRPELAPRHGTLAACEHFRVTRAQTGHMVEPGRFRLIQAVATTHWGGAPLAPGQLALCPASATFPGPDGDWLEIELPVSRLHSRT